jgi:hypothetical protein
MDFPNGNEMEFYKVLFNQGRPFNKVMAAAYPGVKDFAVYNGCERRAAFITG